MAKVERRSLVTLRMDLSEEEAGALDLQRLGREVTEAAEYLEQLRPARELRELPFQLREADQQHLTELARELRANSDVLLVVGAGAIYNGPRAVVEGLGPGFATPHPPVIFAGRELSPARLGALLDWLGDRRLGMVAVSGDELPLETACQFRLLRRHLEERHGAPEARRRIVVVAHPDRGPMREVARQFGYRFLATPREVPGRLALLSPAGLLPAAVAGMDVEQLIQGARSQSRAMEGKGFEEDPALQYAGMRRFLASQGRNVEALVVGEPGLRGLAEWWRQLYAETEAGAERALLPMVVDLVSERYTFEGWVRARRRPLVQTVLAVEQPGPELALPGLDGDADGWECLSGRTLCEVQRALTRCASRNHREEGIPSLVVGVPRLGLFHLGALIVFFQRAATVAAAMSGSDPFQECGPRWPGDPIARHLAEGDGKAD